MMSYKEMILKCKKKESEAQSEKWNIPGAVFRQMSYPITYVLLQTRITPNQISFISLLCTIMGFVIMACAHGNVLIKLAGIIMFVLWNILDCVDGNIARSKALFSKSGDLWDAAAGYSALFLMYFAMSICADQSLNYYVLFLILGGLSGVFTLYPRLLMHFKFHGKTNQINNVNEYGIVKKIVFNIISPDAYVQFFMIVAVILRIEHLFTLAYFMVNGIVCISTCYKLLSEKTD